MQLQIIKPINDYLPAICKRLECGGGGGRPSPFVPKIPPPIAPPKPPPIPPPLAPLPLIDIPIFGMDAPPFTVESDDILTPSNFMVNDN